MSKIKRTLGIYEMKNPEAEYKKELAYTGFYHDDEGNLRSKNMRHFYKGKNHES